MRILGIDPGIAIVGYGIIEYKNNKFNVIDYGTIITPSNMKIEKRLERIYIGVDTLIKTLKQLLPLPNQEELSFLDVLIIINQFMNIHLFKLSKV